MAQGLLGRRTSDPLLVPFSEWTAGGGENDLLDAGGRIDAKRLKGCGVLAVDGNEFGAGPLDLGQENLPCRDKAFLVGKRDAPALAGGGKRRLQSSCSDDGGHYAVGRLGGGLNERRLACSGADPRAGQALLELLVSTLLADDGQAGAVANGKLGKARRIGLRGQRHDVEHLGSSPDEVERALADRAGRAEDRDTLRRSRPLAHCLESDFGCGSGARHVFPAPRS